MLWIILALFGLYVLFSGSVPVTRKLSLDGRPARIFGALLLAPALFQFGMGVYIGATNPDITEEESVRWSGMLGGVSLLWTIGAFVYAILARNSGEDVGPMEIADSRPFGDVYVQAAQKDDTRAA